MLGSLRERQGQNAIDFLKFLLNIDPRNEP